MPQELQWLTFVVSPCRSAAALSSLARALSDSKSVGVVRFALRVRLLLHTGCVCGGTDPDAYFAPQKNSELHLGVLSPVIDERGNYLSLNVLPFAEDLRMHEFAPLPPDSRCEPSAEACAAAESLIGSMMFGSAAAPPRSFAATGDWTSLHNPTMRCVPFCGVTARRLTTPVQAVLRVHEAGCNPRR